MSAAAGVGLALAVTFGTQVVMALPVTLGAVLAPRVAPLLGVAPTMLGVYMATLWTGAALSSLASGALLNRVAPVRSLQLCLVSAALGAWCTATGVFAPMLLGAFLMGVAVGPEVPASVQLLARVTTPANRAFVISAKHTGWTLGSAIVGVVGPASAMAVGWQATLALFGAACALGAVAQEPARRGFDRDHDTGKPARGAVLQSLRMIAVSPPLRRLAVVAVVLTVALNVYMNFLVSLLVIELGVALTLAGTIFTLGQLGAIVGRLTCGSIAGRWIAPGALLLAIGFGMAALSLTVGLADRSWPIAAVAAAAVLLGTVGGGWFGVCLTEVARLAPPDQIGLVTGGVLVFHYLTIILAPLGFAAIAAGLGFGWGFLAVAAVTALGLLPMLRPVRAAA